MSWRESLIRIANFEVEELQKRVGEIVERRSQAEMRLLMLEAEAEAEERNAERDAEAGWYHAGFRQGVRLRRADLQVGMDQIIAEEAGARDALALAFEALKKYEQIAETARLAGAKETARRETLAMDELGLRRALR
jgi:flagellar FliJ protein